MKYLILITIVLASISCTKDDVIASTFLDCEEHTANAKIYTGEVIDCQSYYALTEYNGKQYIQLHSPCADLTRNYVINEDCIDICENEPYNENSECGQYLNGKEFIKILLIYE